MALWWAAMFIGGRPCLSQTWSSMHGLVVGLCRKEFTGVQPKIGVGLDVGVYCMQTRNFPARRHTRERKMKKQRARKLVLLAQAAQREAVASRNKASKAQVSSKLRTSLNEHKDAVTDDVWYSPWFRRKIFTISEAIEMHRETHHPMMMNLPDAPLYLSLELDMSLEKKNRFLDNFSSVIRLPHFFDDGKPKTVIAFSKDEDGQKRALDAGAEMAGGVPLIKRIQSGESILTDYKYVLASTNIIGDLGAIRGILRRRFPVIAKGTLGVDMFALVDHFKHGLEYISERDNVKQDFGWVDVSIGLLSMPVEHLLENVDTIVKSVCVHHKRKLGPFVTAAILTCPPATEKIVVDVTASLPEVQEDDDDDEAADAL